MAPHKQGWLDKYSPKVRHFILLGLMALVTVAGIVANSETALHALHIPDAVVPFVGWGLVYGAAWVTNLTTQYGRGANVTTDDLQHVQDAVTQAATVVEETVAKAPKSSIRNSNIAGKTTPPPAPKPPVTP